MSEANNSHPQSAGEQNGYQGPQQGASYQQPYTQQGYAYQQQPGTGPQPVQSGSSAYTGSGNSGTYNSNSYGPQGGSPYNAGYNAGPQYAPQSPYGTQMPYGAGTHSKIAAGLLGIFLGTLGVRNFYLGYTGKAVAQLLLTVIGWIIIIGPFVSAIWSFVEGIIILCSNPGSPWHRDAAGYELRD